MQIDYLEDGSPDCPLLRIHAFDITTLQALDASVRQLAQGALQAVALHRLPGVQTELELHAMLDRALGGKRGSHGRCRQVREARLGLVCGELGGSALLLGAA